MMINWQSIETARRHIGDEILAYIPPSSTTNVAGVVILTWVRYNGMKAWRDWDMDAQAPTHWMPLPKPPVAS